MDIWNKVGDVYLPFTVTSCGRDLKVPQRLVTEQEYLPDWRNVTFWRTSLLPFPRSSILFLSFVHSNIRLRLGRSWQHVRVISSPAFATDPLLLTKTLKSDGQSENIYKEVTVLSNQVVKVSVHCHRQGYGYRLPLVQLDVVTGRSRG